MGVKKIRFPETSGIGIKPVSREGTERLVRAAIEYALRHKRKSVTLVHKGNIMKFTEGAFKNWGYELAEREFADNVFTWAQYDRIKANRARRLRTRAQKEAMAAGKLIVKDVIADAFLQQILTRPAEYDVIATLNLNGDYISDALAAQVGGIGIAPGRQHQLCHGSRGVRGDARNGAEVRGTRQGQSGLGHSVWRHDVRVHGLAGSGGSYHARSKRPLRRRSSPTTSPA